jgi:hypothetical protein
MELEQQVVSLELAKRLKELGVKQESVFWWVIDEDKKALLYHDGETSVYEGKRYVTYVDGNAKVLGGKTLNKVSAFTVAELGEMLSLHFISKRCEWGNKANSLGKYICERADGLGHKLEFFADTEADARAKMLIYLLKNKLITL